MAEDICPKHGCKTVPITNDEGSAIIAEDCPRCMAERDARDYGNGFTLHHPGGRVEYLPPHRVVIHCNTVNVKTQPSNG